MNGRMNMKMNVTELRHIISDAFKAGWNECQTESEARIKALEEKLRIACKFIEQVSFIPYRDYNTNSLLRWIRETGQELLSKIKVEG